MESSYQARPTVAEIDGGALAHNLRELARVAGPGTGVIAVVKSDGYGHGLTAVATVLARAGAERFAVATSAEGAALRAVGIAGDVLVLGGVYPADVDEVLEARLTPVLWNVDTAAALAARARATGRHVPVHVKVDTGMSRLGVPWGQALELFRALAGLDGVDVEGMLTHFCNAETIGTAETVAQLARFEALVSELADLGLRPPLVHAANSAATLGTPTARFDAVRPGIALYGVHPSAATRAQATLRPVMRLVTRIVALRTIARGAPVGYGATFVATRPSVIATLPVGYADGYPRALSNRGEVVTRGRRAPLAGRVCMDQIMIDVTDVPGATLGDEVVLWGGPLPVEEVAERAGTIAYELLARLGPRVPRVAAGGRTDA
jgi:alanine racemase